MALATGIGGALFLIVSLFDPNFILIVNKPDNIPIVAMIFLVGFFVWLAMYQALENDDRIAAGGDPRRKRGERTRPTSGPTSSTWN